MSATPEALMKLMQSGSPGAQPGQPIGQPQQPGASPNTPSSPMATPAPKEGLRKSAEVNVQIAMNMLEQALPVFGTESKEGKSILEILLKLAKSFGESDTQDLQGSEILQLMRQTPQIGGSAMAQQQLQKAQGAQHPPGQPGQPPGMPGQPPRMM